MTTTVYFATNRAVNNPQDVVSSYTFNMVSPTRPQDVTYGTAFVDSSNLTADTVGAVRSIQQIRKGGFTDDAIGDLETGGRNILVLSIIAVLPVSATTSSGSWPDGEAAPASAATTRRSASRHGTTWR